MMEKLNSEIVNEISLLLAEKRTSLAVLRTALAIFTLPLSVFTILIATSRYYNAIESIHLLTPLIFICILLIILGIYLMFRSFNRIRKIDLEIKKIKK
jgi:uncharacterized membrane protein YidH (DUF202 family)